jgi:iron complex transport system ATP-binding protein
VVTAVRSDTVPHEVGQSALAVRNLSVVIGGRTLLDHVDLQVGTGQWLGVIGPNGAGKSTLLRAVSGLVAHQGEVSVSGGGRPKPTDVALMPQAPTLPPGMSVVEYVMLGRTAHLRWLQQETRADRAVVIDVLRRLELVGFVDRNVDTLSGGEAQRVVVARALAQESPVLLLDEPTSELDIGHQVEVLELVDELRRRDGLTVVAAMHDLGAAAAYADRLLLLRRGSVLRLDEPAQVLQPDLLSEVYGTPLEVHRMEARYVVLPAGRGAGPPPPRADSSPADRTQEGR